IYPLDFVGPKASGLWNALADVVRFWARRGVRIFRVDNPHTKPFAFWEWLLRQIHTEFPGTIFLAEAFTRPGTMYHLAKIGFDESYTYFTWRTTPEELTEYFTELTGPPIRDFFRPMLFTNTPDILSPILVRLGRPAFMARAFLAATLSPLWGLYSGFEDLEGEAVPGTEEYADSEKYRVVPRGGPAPPENIRNFIQRLNELRREHPSLQHPYHLRFLPVEGPGLLAYERWSSDGEDRLVAVVNPVPDRVREGMVRLSEDFPSGGAPFPVEDRLTGEVWTWQGARNYVRLDPSERVAHLFRIRAPGHRSPP
ncbi:alpha-amylase family protein, partial [mine drainage metagenome]